MLNTGGTTGAEGSDSDDDGGAANAEGMAVDETAEAEEGASLDEDGSMEEEVSAGIPVLMRAEESNADGRARGGVDDADEEEGAETELVSPADPVEEEKDDENVDVVGDCDADAWSGCSCCTERLRAMAAAISGSSPLAIAAANSASKSTLKPAGRASRAGI